MQTPAEDRLQRNYEHWTQFVNRIQGEAWGRCYLGTYLVLPRYIDLKIVATKWKLTAVSTIGKRGSRASGCLQCEDGRSGFWAPPSLQSATSASFTGHRFFRLSSPNFRSLAVESWKESSKSDSDPLLQQVFSFFHRSSNILEHSAETKGALCPIKSSFLSLSKSFV